MISSPVQVGDVVAIEGGGLARVFRLAEHGGREIAWLRRYGGDRRTLGHRDVSTLGRTSLLTFAVDDHDKARLRELRRLCIAAGKCSKEEDWGPRDGTLARYARFSLNVTHLLWEDDPVTWTEVIDESIAQARMVAPLGKATMLRVRVPVSLRVGLFDLTDFTRHSLDALLRASVVQQLEVICGDAPVDASVLAPQRRLCKLPPLAAKHARETIECRRRSAAKARAAKKAQKRRMRIENVTDKSPVDPVVLQDVLIDFVELPEPATPKRMARSDGEEP